MPEARQCNDFYAMILVTGTLLVQDSGMGQLFHVAEAAEDEEGEEETRICVFQI